MSPATLPFSFPLLIIWPLITYALARNYLKTATDKANEGLKLGAVFALVNLVLDLLVLVLLFKNGFGYFASVTALHKKSGRRLNAEGVG